MPGKVILMVASGIIVVAVVGVVLLVVNQGGKPATYYATPDNPNNYNGANLPTGPPTNTPPSPETNDEDLSTPMECETRVQTEQCLLVTIYRLVLPHKYYWEQSCGGVKAIVETINGVDIYSYNSLLGSWYHTVENNPQNIDTRLGEAQEIIRQFREHDLIPAGVSITCEPLGPGMPDSEFQPPADANITDMSGI